MWRFESLDRVLGYEAARLRVVKLTKRNLIPSQIFPIFGARASL